MHYKIKELHKLITVLKNNEGLTNEGELLLEGYAVGLEMVVKKNQPKWVAISEQKPPLHNYVILINEGGYMNVEFIHEYHLTTGKYPNNYTHWANLPENPNK